MDALVNLSAIYYNEGRYAEAWELIKRVPTDSGHQDAERFRRLIGEKVGEAE